MCDNCLGLFKHRSQAMPFDGAYICKPLTNTSTRTLKSMWWYGRHDFTWVCTECQMQHYGISDITFFRESHGILQVRQRQKRTAKFKRSSKVLVQTRKKR